MWTTFAFAAALSLAPGQAKKLELTHDRLAYGVLGPTRNDNKFLPGDLFLVIFDIDNLQAAKDGRVLYRMGMEITNSKGKSQFKQDPEDRVGVNSLGGTSLPAWAAGEIGLETPPGEYTVTVTVTDRRAKKTATLTRKVEVLPKGFGLVRLTVLIGGTDQWAPAIGVAGQVVWIDVGAVGFQRGGDKNEPNVSFEMQVFENGKPTLPEPSSGNIDKAAKDLGVAPWRFSLSLNRPGKFIVKLKASDNLGKKTDELSIPITVLERK